MLSLLSRRRLSRLLFLLTFLCGVFSTSEAWAYKATQSKVFATKGATLNFSFTKLPPAYGSMRVTLDLYGNYATSTQYADISFDGGSANRFNPRASGCNTNLLGTQSAKRRVYSVSSATITDAILTVVVKNSASVAAGCGINKVDVTVEYTELKPNLRVTTAYPTNRNVVPGLPVLMNYRIDNPVGIKAGPFKVRFYASTNSTYETTDTYLGTETSFPGIDANGRLPLRSSNLYAVVTLPKTLKSTQVYLLAVVDPDNKVSELNERDNVAFAKITISKTAIDLSVYSVKLATNIGKRGSSVNVSVIVQNKGVTNISNLPIRVYLSKDANLTVDDTYLGRSRSVTLKPGQRTQFTLFGVIPANAPLGRVYVGVIADPFYSQNDFARSNNTKALPFTVRNANFDLTVTSLSSNPTTVSNYSRVTISCRIENQGNDPTGSRSVLSIFYSESTTLDPKKSTLVAQRSLSSIVPGRPVNIVNSFFMPGTVKVGTGYLHAVIDANNEVIESNEKNNQRSLRVSTQRKPELYVDYLRLQNRGNLVGGTTVTISYRVANRGSKTGPFRIRFYYSADSTITSTDTYLGTEVSVSSLDEGRRYPSNIQSVTMKLPTTITNGGRYLGVIVDALRQVDESDEDNNTRAVNFTATGGKSLPDLQTFVRLLTIPAVPGRALLMDVTVNNSGGSASAGASKSRVYLSTDARWDARDTKLGNDISHPSLSVGRASRVRFQTTLPKTLKVGQYWLITIADADKKIVEATENNNMVITPLSVQIPLEPDLTLSGLRVGPSTVKIGQTISASVTVSNIGTADAKNIVVRYYYSRKTPLDVRDRSILYLSVEKKIASLVARRGRTTLSNVQLKFPNSTRIAPGKGYIGAYVFISTGGIQRVVPGASNREYNLTNNAVTFPITVVMDRDGDGVTSDKDCNDNDKTIYPGAKEICDGKDNDCDRKIDDGVVITKACPSSGRRGECAKGQAVCNRGRVQCSYPNARPEICDGKDNNCDGAVDNNPACGKDACRNVQCGAGSYCLLGRCIKRCGCCKQGEFCREGRCFPDPCKSKRCPAGTVCSYQQNGRCVPKRCPSRGCGSGNVCFDGQCMPDPCGFVSCGQDYSCWMGQCRRTQCTQEPVAEPGSSTEPGGPDAGTSQEPSGNEAAPSRERSQGDAGGTSSPDGNNVPEGGCGCSTRTQSAQGGLWYALFFSLLLFAGLRRRRRR